MNVSHIIYVPVADITGSNTAELTTYLGKPGNILYDNDFQKADCYFVGWAEQAIVPDGTLVHQLYTNASKIRLEGGKLQLQLNELPQNPVVHYNPWQNVAADLTNDNGIATLNLYAQYKPLIVMTAEKLWYPLGAKAEYELWIEDPLHNQKPNPDAVAHFGNSQVAMVLMRTTEGKTLDATKYEIIPGFYRTTEDGVNWQWAPQEGHDANGRKYSYLMTEFISPEQEGFHTEEEIIDHFNNKRTWSSMYITMLNKGDNLSKYTAITLKDQTNETHSYLAVTNSNQPDAVQTVKETENYHFTLRNFKVDLALPLIHRIQTNHTEIRIDSPKDGAKYLCLKLPEYTENPIWFSKGDTTWTSNDGNFTISEVNDELIITPLTYDFSDKAGKKVYALFTVNNTDVPLDSNCAFSDVKSYDNLPEITDLKQEPHIKNENGVITHNVVTAKIPAGTYAGAKYTLGYMNGGTFQAVFGNESPDLDEKITFIVPAGTLNGVTTYYIQGIDPALTFKDTVFNETVQMDLTGPVITAQDSFGVTTGDLIGAGDGAVTTDDAKDIITFKYTKGESTVSLPDGIEFDYVAGKFSGKTADVLDVSQTGTYTITVTAEDVFGNVSTKNIAFTVTQKPTTDAITSITQNANNADGDVSLTIQGTKNGILRFYSEESPTVFTEIEIPSLIGSDITNADGTKDIIVPKEEIIRFKDKKIFITQQKANELESNKTDSSVETVDKKNKKKISTGGAVVIDNVAPMPLCVDQPLANTDTLRISNTSVEAVLPDIKDVDKINIKIGAFIECEPKREYDNVTGEPTNIWTCGAGYTFTETEELVWVELDPNDPDNRVQKTVGVLTYKFAEPTKFEEFQVIEAVYYDYLGNASLPVTTSVPKLPDPVAPSDMTAINNSQEHPLTTIIKGKADPGAEISVKIGETTWSVIVDEHGDFTLEIAKQNKGTAITVKSTLNYYSASADVTVQNVMADDYPLTITDINKKYGVSTTEEEIKAAVTIPTYPAGQEPPVVTIDAGQTLPDGNTSGDYTINITVTYQDGSTNKGSVKVSVYYQYTVNYCIRLASGENTVKPVPGLEAKIDSLPLGDGDVGPLPDGGKYALATGQNTVKTIQAQENVFTFYYIDDAPVFVGCGDVSIEHNAVFDPLAGVTVTDDEDISINIFTVQPESIDTSKPGKYTLTYRVTDSGGNETVKQRIVTVKPQPPYDLTAINDSKAHSAKTAVRGKADPGATVSVTISSSQWSMNVGESGEFTLMITKQPTGNVIEVKSTMNGYTKSANVTVQNVMADDYEPTVTAVIKDFGAAASEDEVKAAVTVPGFPQELQQPTVSVDAGQTLPDGNTSGDYTIDVTVTYPDSTTDAATVTIRVKYQYSVKYRRQLEDGTKTDIAVPGINDITGSLLLGPHSFGELQTVGKFAPVAGQDTDVTIQTDNNNFIYYYKDDAPVFSGCDNVVIEYGSDFDPRAGVTATDDEDGDLTASFTVTPDSINTSNPVVYNLEYKVIDSGGNVVTKQRTVTIKPQAPYNMTAINDRQAHQDKTRITGKADKGANISVTIEGTTWSVIADANGDFTLNIDKQNKGEIITVTSKLNNQTTSANVTVQNVLADDYLPTVADIDREYGVATNEAEIKAAVTIPNYPVGEAQPIVTVDEGQTIPDGNTSGDHPINVTVTYSDGSTNKVVVTVSVYYQYTVKYRRQLEDGTNTDIAVPGINDITGSLPLGEHDFDQLQVIGKFAPVAGQNTKKEIKTEGNVFTFYYVDDAPVFSGCDNVVIEYGSDFDPRAGVTATDDEDGDLTASFTVTPDSINTSNPVVYNLEYKVIDSGGNVVTKQRTVTIKPQAPYNMTAINDRQAHETTTVITGKADKGAEISVTIGAKTWGTVVDNNGNFTLNIDKQNKGEIITVTSKLNNQTTSANVTVQNVLADDYLPTVADIDREYGVATNEAEIKAAVTIPNYPVGEAQPIVTVDEGQTIPDGNTSGDHPINVTVTYSDGSTNKVVVTVSVYYQYTVKYRRQLEDGTNTDIVVPGINDITGSLPLGEHDFDQLQVVGKFAPVAGQNTKKEIKTEGNVFTFYYVDDAPVFNDFGNVIIEYGAPFNLREGITVTDDEDGDLTALFTVTPDSINTSNPVVYNLEYKVIDSGGNVVTKQRTVTIKPQAPYNMTAINDRQTHETTTVITGKADKGAEISVTIEGTTWSVIADANGNFTLNIDKQNKGEIITVTSKLNNQTTSANVTVQNVLADDYLPTVADIDREYGVATNEAEIKAAVTIPNYPVGEAQPIVTIDQGQTIPDGNTSGDHPINVTVTYSDGSTNKVVVTVSVYYQYTINNRIRLENGNNTAKPVPDKPQEVGSLPLGAHNFQLQAIGQYAPAANQITDVTIQTEGNVFTFYYIDEAPVFTEFEDIYVGYNDAFNPKTGIKAIDDEEGEIEYTVTPAAIDTSVPDEYILTYRAEDSSGNVTVKTRKITVLPQPVYDYTIYFLIQLENGNKTDKAVPNKLPKTGQLPEGPYSFGQLQPIGKYAPVPNQVTDVTIQTEGNVFTFYYIDEAPVFTGCEDIIIEYGTPFNPRAGVAVTDDEEGEVEYTVTPEVNVNQPSDYVLTYRAEDSSGNVTVKARTVTVLPRAPYDLTAINNRQLHPTTTVITGKANPGAVISVEIAPKTWAVQVGAQGNFTLSIDKQLKDTVIEVKATLNNHIKSANVIVQNVQADDYLPTVADIVKQYGVPATQAEVTNAVTVPNYPAGQQQPAVTVDAGQTIPDGNTSGDYPINVTVTYPDGSANAATVKVSVLYRYKVNYRIRLEDGSNTNKQVPGINDITGSLPLGAHDFGQLQVVGQYTPAANQNTDVTIQTEGNVFTFYYIDDAPVFTGCDNVVIEHGIPFNPRAGVTVADDEDGDLTDSFTVQPANIDTTDPKIYVLEYKVTDSGGNVVTKQRTVTIKPQAPYNMTAINDSKAHETTTVITGKADKGAEISVTIGNDTWNTVVDNNGNFTLNIDKQNKGVVLEVKATLNNHTKSANVIVQNVQADDYEPTVIDIFKKFGVATTEAEVKAAVAVENYPAGQLQPAVTVNLAELPDGLTSGDNQVSVTVTYPDGTKDDVKVTVKVNYRYKVNYFIRLANGDNTTKPVPNILPKTGDLPVGQHELGPLPDGGAYAKVENQGTLVTIDGTTDNVFNFYYVDDAPVFNDFDDVILMYGALINPKMDVTAIDDEDGEIDFTVAPKIDTTVPGIYTVTYRAEDSGGNVTEKTRKVTVNQAQNVTYEPVVVPEIVEYNGVVNLKDNVTNLQQLPEGTMILDTTHPAIDTTVPGKHTGQITVIYRDGTSDVFNVDVTVQPQPMNQIYEPDVFPEIVEYGEVINLLDNIANADTFPDNTDISDTTDPVIDTTVPGVYKGQITVTYPDGTKDVVNVKVTVNPQPDIPDNQVYNPNVVDEVVEYDGVIDLTDNVLNFENLPDGTQVADTTAQPIDTKVPGTYPGQLTITYPDQTTDVYNIQVTVKTQPHNEKYVPVVIPEIVEYGDVINLKDNVTNADTFPLNTVISDTTDPVIDSTVPGLYRGEITVTYPDGTKNVVNVQVTVKHKPDIPDNQSYNPVVVDETVPYGGVIDLTDNVTNLDNLPDQTTVTDTTAQPIDTRLPGTYAGEITITYPDQTTTVINVQVTVQPQPLNEKFEPVVVPEIVEYSGVINLKDNVTNADELPLNTVIADTTVPPINTRLPGVYTGQITVTYPDQTTDVVDVQVRVQPEPDYLADEEVNAPVVIDEIVAYGGVIDLTDNVLNLKDLPAGTRVMEIYKQEIDTTVPGTYRGQLAVIYPDASVIVSDVRIIVKEQTQSDTHNPVVRDDETVGYGEDIDWKDVIDNIDDLPPGTTVTETSENPIDTTVPGTHQGQVTVTYPDGSQEVIDVTVTVEEQPQSDIHNPVVRDDETVGYGEDIDWKDVIDNIDDLPPGTTVTETSENPIDTTVPGTHQGQVTVTYPDGSQEVIDVTVTVEEQPQSDIHNPVVRDDETVGYGEDIDWKDVIDNIDDLPPGTTVTETSENPIDTTVPGTHQGQVTVTYPDGSQEVIDVTVTVEEQPQSDTHNPVVRDDEIVGYGEEIDWRDVIDNIDDLPPGTTVTETSENPIDTTVPGTHQGQVTITYPDGSQEVIDVTVTVEEQPQSDIHNPVVRDDEIVGYGEEIDWRDVIDNIDDLPPGTTVTETSENPIDTTVPGTHQGQVTVTYPDGSQEVIDVTVTVEEQPQSDRYNPVIGSETVEYGKEIEWKDVVENMEDLPEGTTVTDTSAQPLDTTVPGTYIREITITYPDGSTEVMEVEVTVKEDSGQAPSPTPGPDTEEETPEEVKEESWSLVSVISTVFSALAMLIQFLIKSVKVDDSGAHFVRNKIFKLITAVLAVVAIVYLFSTNNLSLTMRMVNETTPVSAIMTVATTTSLILGMRWKPSKK